MWTNCQLLILTRYPEAGTTKTRLIQELGASGAALLQKKLSEKTVHQAQLLTRQSGIKTVVHYSGGSRKKMTAWLGAMEYVEQTEGDLGQRMRQAFTHAVQTGAEKIVLIGSDIPDITADLLQSAFTFLKTKEMVIGPSEDGGYYLIGMVADQATRLLPLLFENMPWSSERLLAITRSRLETSGSDVAILPTLRDIDLPADLTFAREKGLL
ncbi:MAG: hypothetical protein CR992_00420 [Desulfobacterales bacterium]|nr:MAG: hypothetical protein CR992_00420 [Desulfobacterales bacterium]